MANWDFMGEVIKNWNPGFSDGFLKDIEARWASVYGPKPESEREAGKIMKLSELLADIELVIRDFGDLEICGDPHLVAESIMDGVRTWVDVIASEYGVNELGSGSAGVVYSITNYDDDGYIEEEIQQGLVP